MPLDAQPCVQASDVCLPNLEYWLVVVPQVLADLLQGGGDGTELRAARGTADLRVRDRLTWKIESKQPQVAEAAATQKEIVCAIGASIPHNAYYRYSEIESVLSRTSGY